MSNEVSTETRERELQPFRSMAKRLGADAEQVESLIVNMMMRAKKNQIVTRDEVAAFMIVANEYKLNPIAKEVWAFVSRGGAIQPVVSVDGWLRIMNSNPQFDGLEFEDRINNDGELVAITARVYRKDRSHPTEVTEYMAECKQPQKEPWQKWPIRMLRHKAAIQAARYAFGLSGIYDPDEAERIQSATDATFEEVHDEPADATFEEEAYPEEDFEKHFPVWENAIERGWRTHEEIINTVQSKGPLTQEQLTKLMSVKSPPAPETIDEGTPYEDS